MSNNKKLKINGKDATQKSIDGLLKRVKELADDNKKLKKELGESKTDKSIPTEVKKEWEPHPKKEGLLIHKGLKQIKIIKNGIVFNDNISEDTLKKYL